MRKKLISFVLLTLISCSAIRAQCVPSCSIYSVSPITFTTFPSTGNSLSLSDDDISGVIPIGFTFTFFCNSYSSLLICSNGWLTFDLTNTTASYPGQSIPSSQIPNNFVAFDWTDLDPSSGGSITYTTVGTAPNRQFVLTFSNVPCYGSFIPNTCQTILYETSNKIEIHCAQIGNNGSTCTQGVENSNGTSGFFRPNANASYWTVSVPDAYRYELGYLPLPPTSVSGSTLLCEGSIETYLASTMPGANAYGWSFPSGWVGTSSVSAVNATAGVSGNLSVTATYTCGTSAPATLAITTLTEPTMAISSNSIIVCAGQSVTINGSGNGAVSYTLDPLGTVGNPPFIVNPNITTVYTLFGENSNGCVSNNSASLTVTVKATPTVFVNNGSICLGQPFTLTPSGADTYVYSSLFASFTPTSAGIHTYTVIGTYTSSGCPSEPAISTVTVKTLPNVLLNANQYTICAKESATITASGANTYSWVSSSATSNTLIVAPLSTTIYTLVGSSDGCSKSATVMITVNSCVGMTELDQQESIVSVFPNPSNERIYIETAMELEIYIVDAIGKVVYRKKLEAGVHPVEMSEWSRGVYFLQVNHGNHIQRKVILKHE